MKDFCVAVVCGLATFIGIKIVTNKVIPAMVSTICGLIEKIGELKEKYECKKLFNEIYGNPEKECA